MKTFIKELPKQISYTFTIMITVFLTIALLKGVKEISIYRLIQLLVIAVLAGALQLIAFSDIFIKKMSDIKRVTIFIVPFGLITLLFVIIFNWFSINLIKSWVIFFGIFLGCFIISIMIFEIEHKIKGEEYTGKLIEYKNKEKK